MGYGSDGHWLRTGAENFRDLIKTSVDTQAVCAACTSVLVRIPFEIEDLDSIRALTLRMKYDDGFVAYLNGVEVARRNITGEPSFDTLAQGHLDSEAVRFENIVISEHIGLLQAGANVLAIHASNINAGNSDMLISPELVSGEFGDENAAGIPHAQDETAHVQFGEFEHDPSSGNQDEEFIELVNPHKLAMDISGWRLQGGVDYHFQPGTIIPAGGTLYVSPNPWAFRHRTSAPTGSSGLFVQGGYQGHLSNLGEFVQLVTPDGRVISTLRTPTTPSLAQQYLRISELHFHPADPDELTEFIELTNISHGPDAVPLDLAGVTISSGPNEPFVFPQGTILQAGAHVLVVRNHTALTAAFPNVLREIIVGEFAGRLDNGGERIKVEDPNHSTVVEFIYGDRAPWPPQADGGGASLTLMDPASDPNDPAHWRAIPPTPGFADKFPGDFDQDGRLGHGDLALFCAGLLAGDLRFDLNGDGVTTQQDLVVLVKVIMGTRFGDANLDGVFNSSDLVQVFQRGTYEDTVNANSSWADGDWNCDGEFGTSDLVLAFQMGDYTTQAFPRRRADAAAVDLLFRNH